MSPDSPNGFDARQLAYRPLAQGRVVCSFLYYIEPVLIHWHRKSVRECGAQRIPRGPIARWLGSGSLLSRTVFESKRSTRCECEWDPVAMDLVRGSRLTPLRCGDSQLGCVRCKPHQIGCIGAYRPPS